MALCYYLSYLHDGIFLDHAVGVMFMMEFNIPLTKWKCMHVQNKYIFVLSSNNITENRIYSFKFKVVPDTQVPCGHLNKVSISEY